MGGVAWLTLGQVTEIHSRNVDRYGGARGIRDAGLLDSALDRPRNKWAYGERDILALAAAYAFGLARNHPFVDGNKRTAFIAMAVFLGANSRALTAPNDDATATMLALATGTLSEEALAAWLAGVTEPRPGCSEVG